MHLTKYGGARGRPRRNNNQGVFGHNAFLAVGLCASSMRMGSSVRLNGWSTRPGISSVTKPRSAPPGSPRITGVCASSREREKTLGNYA
jgi:hypothetical protein